MGHTQSFGACRQKTNSTCKSFVLINAFSLRVKMEDVEGLSQKETRVVTLPSTSIRARDREFLPAALELLESPTSPVTIKFIWLICLIFTTFLAWSYFGKLDIYASANGKIQPAGRTKIVQPLEAGKVSSIKVQNNSLVAQGDVLLELDPTESAADENALAHDVEAGDAEVSRRRTAVSVASSGDLSPQRITFNSNVEENIRRREQAVLDADLGQLAASRESLRAQVVQHQATKERLEESIASREKLIELAKERSEIREVLIERGVGSRVLTIEALQQYQTELTTQIGEKGQLREAKAAMEAAKRKIDETISQFIADQSQKLAEAERKRDHLAQDLIKAQTKSSRTQLRTPIAGTVHQLAVSTIGQVVTSAESLMTIVPLDAPLEVEAFISNKDIGFVKVGQQAVVKIEAFPFGRYGTVDGTIASVSRDSVSIRDALDVATAKTPGKTQGAENPNAAGSDFVYPAIVSLLRHSIMIDGQEIDFSAGMAVTVEVKTGQRRVIDYLLSPIREVTFQTGHER
jgi:hemolysin D